MGWELVQDGKNAKCWINLGEIEIYTEGTCKNRRNWQNSFNKKIGVRYQWKNDDIEEEWFVITNYILEKKPLLTLIDKNSREYKITSDNLCIGRVGKIFNKITNDFKYNIGDEINGLIFIDKKYVKCGKRGDNVKYYQYKCKKCGNINWIRETDIKRRGHCSKCFKQKTIKGVNDIATTHPYLCKYFVNQDDIYKCSHGSNEIFLLQCPNCGCRKKMKPNTLSRQGFSCPNCSDGISYPEKFMINILSQLNIKFIIQLSHTTFDWCQNFRYDFYLTDYDIIIETHGIQHYKDTFGVFKTYKEEHENDMFKYDMAVLNGFEYNKNYFIIDSRESTLEWMKKNIIKTLGHIFDLSNIDWEKADLECQKSHMILACQLKRENPDLFSFEIVELIKKEVGVEYTKVSIRNWLKRGNKLGLCYYNGKEESDRYKGNKKMSEETRQKMGKSRKGKHLSEETKRKIGEANRGKHPSEETRAKMSEARKGEKHPMYGKHRSEETKRKIGEANRGKLIDRFTIDGQYVDTHYRPEYVQLGLDASSISACCNGRRKTHKGFAFKYHEE